MHLVAKYGESGHDDVLSIHIYSDPDDPVGLYSSSSSTLHIGQCIRFFSKFFYGKLLYSDVFGVNFQSMCTLPPQTFSISASHAIPQGRVQQLAIMAAPTSVSNNVYTTTRFLITSA